LKSIVPNYFFDFLLPPDFFLLDDLEALSFFEDPPLDFLAEDFLEALVFLADDFLDPPLDLLAEDDLPLPFLDF
jgi:hypothetical protein